MATEKTRREIELRFGEITKDNIGQLRTLNLATFPVTYHDKFYKDILKEETKDLMKLAFHSDNLVGAMCCRIEGPTGTGGAALPKEAKKQEDSDKTKEKKENESGAKRVYIMTLGVLARYRGYGIGTKMVETIISYAEKRKDIGDIFLHVQISNNYAIEFYKRFGFQIVGTIPKYYKRIQPADCYILSRPIASSTPTKP